MTQVENYDGQVAWTTVNPCCLEMCGSESSAGMGLILFCRSGQRKDPTRISYNMLALELNILLL